MHTKQSFHTIWITLSFAGLLFIALHSSTAIAEAEAPLAARCPGIGPLSLEEDYCGCTWGEIYYQGEPVEDLEISLSYSGQSTSTLTFVGVEGQPAYYELTGALLGAKRGDIMTLTVEYGAQLIKYPFRASPDENGEQYIPIVLPDTINSRTINASGYNQALLIDGNTIWAGGEAGLAHYDLTDSSNYTVTLPWSESEILELTSGKPDSVIVVGRDGFAEYNGSEWTTSTVPITGTVRIAHYDSTTNSTWIGGGTQASESAPPTGSVFQRADSSTVWELAGRFNAVVTGLLTDRSGGIWVGTWGEGLFYSSADNDSWVQYTIDDGLSSDFIYDLAKSGHEKDNDYWLWIATRPYLSTSGVHGGLSKIQPSTGLWQTYGIQNGLVADEALLGAVGDIYTLAIDDNSVWLGTDTGLQRQVQSSRWLAIAPELARIHDITVQQGRVAVAHQGGITVYTLDDDAEDADALVPIVKDLQFASNNPVLKTSRLRLTAVGQVSALSDASIVGWTWQSDIDGPICTTASQCSVNASELQVGDHVISVVVQDSTGRWSNPATLSISIVARDNTYIPSVFSTDPLQQ